MEKSFELLGISNEIEKLSIKTEEKYKGNFEEKNSFHRIFCHNGDSNIFFCLESNKLSFYQ